MKGRSELRAGVSERVRRAGGHEGNGGTEVRGEVKGSACESVMEHEIGGPRGREEGIGRGRVKVRVKISRSGSISLLSQFEKSSR